MKKLLISTVLLLFLVVGCSATNNSVKQSDIKGYWLQIEENISGEITDLRNNKYAYFEVTDDRAFFHTVFSDGGSGHSDKYYKLENNKFYYDYYELKGKDWKENINDLYGGIYDVSIENGNLILTKHFTEDRYEKLTYEKVEVKDWPIEE